ncbi:MAG: hypothetical protein GEV07_07185 [Streptosporangiales bacterium]|nr:hypothetical protein [Streptosporangiales bacterium]
MFPRTRAGRHARTPPAAARPRLPLQRALAAVVVAVVSVAFLVALVVRVSVEAGGARSSTSASPDVRSTKAAHGPNPRWLFAPPLADEEMHTPSSRRTTEGNRDERTRRATRSPDPTTSAPVATKSPTLRDPSPPSSRNTRACKSHPRKDRRCP